MNGLKCYLTRDQVKNLIQAEIEKKLDPSELLGDFTVDVSLCDDGRVEITFWRRDTEGFETTNGESDGISAPGDHFPRAAAG